MTTITALPTAPSRSDPANFATRADAFLAALPTMVTEINTLTAALNSIAAGTAVALPYTFSTTTTDADPGAGYLRLDNATQNAATTIRCDLVGADGSTFTDVIATFDDSTSTIKGFIKLMALADPTKWLLFSVSALASPSGYRNITVAPVASSAANPFANNDEVVLTFTRNGDKGDTGASASSTLNRTIYTSGVNTFTPSATGYYDVQLWGAGGGNSGASSTGGGGGGYCRKIMYLTGGVGITATVGAGSSGGAGGNTTFSTLTANGGSASTSGSAAAGGTASGGDTNISGTPGLGISGITILGSAFGTFTKALANDAGNGLAPGGGGGQQGNYGSFAGGAGRIEIFFLG